MKLTKAGVLYIVLTLFIGFAAVNTGNNLLFLVVSALLGFMAVSGIFGWMNLRGNDLLVELPDEIYDGVDTLVSIRLRNGKSVMPSFLVRVKIFGEDAAFTMVGRSEAESGSILCRFHGRGRKTPGELRIESCFPINFFVRSKKYDIPGNFVVFPAPKTCALPAGLGDKGMRGEAIARQKGSDGDLLRILDYTGKEPLKLIHWRISAKHEDLKVKEMTSSVNQPLILDVDNLPGDDLERALSYGAFLVNSFIRRNRPVGLKAGRTLINPDVSRTHRLALLTELAVYGKN